MCPKCLQDLKCALNILSFGVKIMWFMLSVETLQSYTCTANNLKKKSTEYPKNNTLKTEKAKVK